MVAIGDETGEEMDDEVERAAVAGVLDLTHILELVVDALNERALAQEQLLGEIHQDIAHVLAQFRDEAQALLQQEALGEGRRDGALIATEAATELAEEPAEEASDETRDRTRDRTPVVGIARGEADGE